MFAAMAQVTFFLTVLFNDGSAIKQEFTTYDACETARIALVQKMNANKTIVAQGCLRQRADGKSSAQ